MESSRGFTTAHIEYELRETDNPETVFVPHCHDEYEIYCVLSGDVTFRVEGAAFTPHRGDLLLLERSRFHSADASAKNEPYRRAVLHFSPEILHRDEQVLLQPFRAAEVLYPGAWEGGLAERFALLEKAAEAPETIRDIAVRTETVSILAALFAMSGSATGPAAAHPQVQEVLRYINANLTSPLTVEGLAEQFYLSRNSLARNFKKATGSTVGDYILYKRMALARIFLRAGHPAGVAARECGFTDYSTFYRGYKKIYGQSPAAPLEDGQIDEVAPTVLAPDAGAL